MIRRVPVLLAAVVIFTAATARAEVTRVSVTRRADIAFFEEAEKSISAHPAQSVVGAFLAGVLVGRLLGRR